jgi:hypothetical protein
MLQKQTTGEHDSRSEPNGLIALARLLARIAAEEAGLKDSAVAPTTVSRDTISSGSHTTKTGNES